MSDTIIRCRWVPLADKLPDDGEWVLLAWDGTVPTNTRGIFVGDTHFEICYRENGRWLIAANTPAQFVNTYAPTHWMKLPPHPIGTPPDIVCVRKAKE
jgi:hypothetical protein